jgi:predicted Zn-ribbon and HTH transcriptional regulator
MPDVAEALTRVKRTVWVWLCTCARCGHKWESYRPTAPVTCARCKSRDWQRPARYKHKPKS